MRLSPRLWSCSSTRCVPAFPTATTQIKEATPTIIPSMVRMLRILFRSNERIASRKTEENCIAFILLRIKNHQPERVLLYWVFHHLTLKHLLLKFHFSD